VIRALNWPSGPWQCRYFHGIVGMAWPELVHGFIGSMSLTVI
jgi:hypothetical protein